MLRHVEEVSFNVAATCRYYGISRQCYYGWLRRYEADGLDGLKDRSSRPHHSPRMTQAEPRQWQWATRCPLPEPETLLTTSSAESVSLFVGAP